MIGKIMLGLVLIGLFVFFGTLALGPVMLSSMISREEEERGQS
jgi:hypothetical protein